jgi:amino acid adenylation domain-containing protein
MNLERQLLVDGFLESAARGPQRIALDAAGATFTYAELLRLAGLVGQDLSGIAGPGPALCGVFAGLNVASYAGMLGALLAGRGFVTLNPSQPLERLGKICVRTDLRVIIIGEDALPLLGELLRTCSNVACVIGVQDSQALREFAATHPCVKVLCSAEQGGSPDVEAMRRRLEVRTSADIAYVMFTSGSTGEPKGVPVSNGNVIAYVRNAGAFVRGEPTDRFAQCSDLSFDLSVHPVWLAWECGAALCVVPENSKMAPAKFIRQKEITIWTSVPSVVTFLKRMHFLTPGAFPTIRHSMFCGEPLTAEQVGAWQQACPASIIDNFYGPTEATVAITALRCARPLQPDAAPNGIVGIGVPFADQSVALVDEDLRRVAPGTAGELLLAGSQVTTGYLGDEALSRSRYVRIPELGGTLWYRTGDLARMDASGQLYFVGRVDLQIKIAGFRVELQEVESVVKEVSRAELVAGIAWPVKAGAAQGIHCFMTGGDLDVSEREILSHCRRVLPHYMVPQRVHALRELPLSANGKIDRKALTRLLSEQIDG